MANLDGATSGRFTGAGQLAPSDSVIDALIDDEFFSGTLLRSDEYYYGMPFAGESIVVWYRKDLFEEAGVVSLLMWPHCQENSKLSKNK